MRESVTIRRDEGRVRSGWPLLRDAFIASAVVWAALIVAAPYPCQPRAHVDALASALILAVYGLGSLICHQLPERSYHLWAAQMPVCARCAGIYFGAVLGAWKTAGNPVPLPNSWNVRFTQGGPRPPDPVQISELKSWTEFAGEPGKSFSGTSVYTLNFAKPTGNGPFRLDLGRVAESARVKLNGQDIVR